MNVASAFFLLTGSFLCISGGVGLLRFPDFYNRLHAAGITDTLASAMILIGLMLQNPHALVIVKLLIILLMILLISPTASHALAQAALRNDVKPVLDKKGVMSSKS